FAARKADGSAVTWGDSECGGSNAAVCEKVAAGVKQVCATRDAFAAVKEDGSVVVWGEAKHGGDSTVVANVLDSGVRQVYSNSVAFAAIKENGGIVTWGDQTAVASVLARGADIVCVYSTKFAFAAVRADGSVTSWGDPASGGDSTTVELELHSWQLVVPWAPEPFEPVMSA
ncbi:unnamed protein product, partial [Polarella glacialis]